VKLLQLPHAPLRLEVARRHNGNHYARVAKLMNDGLVKHVVAAEFQIPPDARFFSCQLSNTSAEYLVKLGNPTLVLLCHRLIVDVRVADKNIVQGVLIKGYID